MPLVLRTVGGPATPVPENCALEFLDDFGRLVMVVIQRHDGSVKMATHGDPDFNAYANINRLQTSRAIVHEPPPTKSQI